MLSLLRAGARSAGSSVAVTLVIAALTAGVVITTLATAGRTVAAERSVLATIDDEFVTTITVIDDQGTAALDADYLRSVQGLNTVDWVVALGEIEDVRPLGLPGADAIASRRMLGSSPALQTRSDLHVLARDVTLTPVAVVGPGAQQQLGFKGPAGTVATFRGVQIPVVGPVAPADPLRGLGGQVLIVDPEFDGPLRRLIIQVESPEQVEATARVVQQLAPNGDARVVVADELVRIRAAIQGELGGAGRSTVLQTMAAMLALVALVLYAFLHARRKDFGRRRALGATRVQLVVIVCSQVAFAAVPGALLGAAGGSLAIYWLTGATVGVAYPVAIAVLAVLTALVAALPPAFVAAHRDPVAALRTP